MFGIEHYALRVICEVTVLHTGVDRKKFLFEYVHGFIFCILKNLDHKRDKKRYLQRRRKSLTFHLETSPTFRRKENRHLTQDQNNK